MPTFPKKKADIVQLAQDVSKGLRAHSDVFPSPPISPDDMDKEIAVFAADHATAVDATAKSKQGHTAKDLSLKTVEDSTKRNLKYAENQAHNDAGKLKLIGWDARRVPVRPIATVAPGQVTLLKIDKEGKGTIALSWKAPTTGGRPAGYRLEHQKDDGTGDWAEVASSTRTNITLAGQEVGVAYRYQIVAFNKAGDAPPSNVVRAVL